MYDLYDFLGAKSGTECATNHRTALRRLSRYGRAENLARESAAKPEPHAWSR